MSFYEIVFSPTGGTSKVAGILAAELGADPARIDLTEHPSDTELGPDDVAVIAVPSFGGRVPRTARSERSTPGTRRASTRTPASRACAA